ncbi:hypothetical protein MACK_003761 [Theileria orientalis]|uniref:Uncharacterized protein n=1 Tax=Theileria orientalis TaxID=68886 RepID=A0A976SIU6_THEOR|nr:hypothetical protein MACK_003761 [Theileria orientalis]
MIMPFSNLLNSIVEPKKVMSIKHENNQGYFVQNEIDESELLFDQKIKAFENLLKNLRPQNLNNVKSVIENEFEEFSNFPIIKSSDSQNKDLTSLCPVLINSIPTLLVPFQQPFLKYYGDDIKTANILFQVSIMYALIRGLFDSISPGQSRLTSLKNGIVHGLRTFRGLALFELFCVLQRKIISSKFYFENEKKKDALIMSFLLSLSTFVSMAAIMTTQKYFFGPFLISRMAL